MYDDTISRATLNPNVSAATSEGRVSTKKRKILVLGSPGVGKSAMIMRFKDDIFLDYYDPTIQTTIKKTLQFNNENIELELIDIDGQTEYTIFSYSKFSFGIHGYILSYSIENRQSFELLKIIQSKLITLVGRDVPKILVANKCDLNNRREISIDEGRFLSKTMNCPFIEVSAKSSDNINKMFHTMLVEIKKYENNVDIKGLTCKKLFEFFIKNEYCLIKFFYVLMFANIFIGGFYLFYGFYAGIFSIYKNNIIVGAILLIGLWDIIFTCLGIHGVYNRRKEFINYYSIGLFFSVVFVLSTIVIHFLSNDVGEGEIKHDQIKNTFIYIGVPITVFLEIIQLFFSCMFQKIYREDLSSYMVV